MNTPQVYKLNTDFIFLYLFRNYVICEVKKNFASLRSALKGLHSPVPYISFTYSTLISNAYIFSNGLSRADKGALTSSIFLFSWLMTPFLYFSFFFSLSLWISLKSSNLAHKTSNKFSLFKNVYIWLILFIKQNL